MGTRRRSGRRPSYAPLIYRQNSVTLFPPSFQQRATPSSGSCRVYVEDARACAKDSQTDREQLSTALPSLKDQGIDQLYPPSPTADTGRESPSRPSQPVNHAYYLLKISKSLLLNFLEFVGILSVSPEQFEPKVDDMRNLFINAHHLLNLYRPHQARESLILLMEEQLNRTKEEIQQMDKTKADIEGFLGQLRSEGVDVDAAAADTGDGRPADESARSEHSQLVWNLLDEDR